MSRLTDLIYLLYSFQDSDIDDLARKITERRKATWINQLSDLARTHGCRQLAGTPKRDDARELERRSREDAQSIARTYNTHLRNELNRLIAENPRGNRNFFYSRLERWAAQRDNWKSLQIALNTDGTARQFASSRFYENNPQLARGFVADGPPPTCERCLRVFAAGVVDYAYTQVYAFPLHINCPHFYRSVAPVKAECGRLWLG